MTDTPQPTVRPLHEDRLLMPALRRGWSGTCPRCGEGDLFGGYLNVKDHCAHCGQALHHHRADDLPAWICMVLVGKVLILLLPTIEIFFAPPFWVHALIWTPLIIGLTLWLLPRVKGSVVGMQWAWRMHGFDGDPG